jgi:pyruvate dehydrogenase E2 component (dihydrolipoamide acetyltransferase)
MTPFFLPDLGEGLQEAEIVAWLVAEGEHVVVDQPLVSVETEKAVVEIPSPRSGHVAQLLARPGERVKVGAPLLSFEAGPHPEAGTVVGELSRPAPAPARLPASGPSAGILATPAVRARARERGVELSQVRPTGPHGTVTLADLEVAANAMTPVTTLRGARRSMALNMSRAGREVVHATLYDQADIDGWSPREDVTCRLVRAVVAGCQAESSFNARFDAQSLTLRENRSIDLGLAIDSPDGLFVPVLRDAARLTPEQRRQQIDHAKRAVQERSLTPDALREPTITLSNFGNIAGQYAALIIVPPQVAILGAGRIGDQAIRTASGIALHRSLPLSLSFDHRALTGGQAARFLRAAIADLEQVT